MLTKIISSVVELTFADKKLENLANDVFRNLTGNYHKEK